MQCPRHPDTAVCGHCALCGDAICARCSVACKQLFFCLRDAKTVEEEAKRKRISVDAIGGEVFPSLVVHSRKGKVGYGYAPLLNPEFSDFLFILADAAGKPLGRAATVAFNALKAVFYVRTFQGNPNHPPLPDWDSEKPLEPIGNHSYPMVLEFEDGEVLCGYIEGQPQLSRPRFYLDTQRVYPNTYAVLVERAALKAIYSAAEYWHKHQAEMENFFRRKQSKGYLREELAGDYYVDRRDFSRALLHYQKAVPAGADPVRIRRKICTVYYNLATQYIKQGDLARAVAFAEKMRQLEPDDAKVNQKAAKVHAYVAKIQKGGGATPMSFSTGISEP